MSQLDVKPSLSCKTFVRFFIFFILGGVCFSLHKNILQREGGQCQRAAFYCTIGRTSSGRGGRGTPRKVVEFTEGLSLTVYGSSDIADAKLVYSPPVTNVREPHLIIEQFTCCL